MYLPLKWIEPKLSSILFCYLMFFLGIACNRDRIDCSGGQRTPDVTYNHDLGALTDSSLVLFPNNLPASSTFKNNFNHVNLLSKTELKGGNKTYTYFTKTTERPCYDYKETYIKNVSFQFINLEPMSQPNFIHSYTRTRYIEFLNYLNLNPKIYLDSTYEIVSVTLNSPFNSYAFIVPIGKVKDKLTNYTYFDTLTLSGVSFNNIYHIFADSTNYDRNKVAPQGLYYHKNEGLVAFYLSSGELWVRQ